MVEFLALFYVHDPPFIVFFFLEFIRLGSDLLFLFFVVDEYTDVANADEANKIRQVVMDAVRNPHKERPEGEHVTGAMFREYVQCLSRPIQFFLIPRSFCVRASNYVSPGAGCLGHFIRDFDDYTAAVVTEARIRNQRRHTSFQDYLKLRLYTIDISKKVSNIHRVVGITNQHDYFNRLS